MNMARRIFFVISAARRLYSNEGVDVFRQSVIIIIILIVYWLRRESGTSIGVPHPEL